MLLALIILFTASVANAAAIVPLDTRSNTAAAVDTGDVFPIPSDARQLVGRASEEINKRREFTKQTVDYAMAIPNKPEKWVAAACYNQKWGVAKQENTGQVRSVSLDVGPYTVTYDCMYLARDNAFWTYGDGGYENLAYSYYPDACTFDPTTSDLTCPP
ncbi:hypothetical protein L13192_02714 [Pyrenophora tritici-repentis]|nr:hypothetical protein L13192_02714 [Pyrenophora tritici-repentis]